MGGTAFIPVHFHATTIAGEVLGRLIDKKCGGFIKINAAKSVGKECALRADKGRILILPPCSIAESGAPISESARTGDSLRVLPNRSSALWGAVSRCARGLIRPKCPVD